MRVTGFIDWRGAAAIEGGCSAQLWHQLADARRQAHPDDSVGVYVRLLDNVLEQTDIRAYREAVALLRQIRRALGDRDAEFAAEVRRIRDAHARRPKLMSLLAAQGW